MSPKRLITAAVLLPLLILYIMRLPAVYFAGLLAVASFVGLMEFYGMYRLRRSLKLPGSLLGMMVIAEIYTTGSAHYTLAASVLIITTIRLFAVRTPGSSLSEIATVIFGLLYVPLLLGYQLPIVKAYPGLVVYLYGSVWAADAAALYIGKSIGKRKLYESVSPKKTVAGAVGSVGGGVFGAAVLKPFLLHDIPWWFALTAGAAIGAVTVVGDLVESMFKRDAGVKDSGSFIPGHGGMLDKIDGSVFAGPVLLWMLYATGFMPPG